MLVSCRQGVRVFRPGTAFSSFMHAALFLHSAVIFQRLDAIMYVAAHCVAVAAMVSPARIWGVVSVGGLSCRSVCMSVLFKCV